MMDIRIDNADNFYVCLSGRFDTMTAPEMETVFQDKYVKDDCEKNIIVDFENLEYISSAGLRVLLLMQKQANANHAKCSVINVSKDIYDILDITGFTDILIVCEATE